MSAIRRPTSLLTRLAVAALVLAAIFAGAWWYQRDTTDPDVVFNRALAATLSTRQVEQVTELSGISVRTQYDLAKSSDPRVMTLLTARQGDRASAVKGYGSLKNLYMAYTATGTPSDKLVPEQLMNHWVQLRKDGAFLPGATDSLMSAADPRFALFGQFIFANVPGKQRQELLDLLAKQKVYTYDTAKVTKAKLNSRDVYVYKVKINPTGLASYNKKAAAVFGLKESDIQLALNGLGGVTDATLYIETGSKRLVKVEVPEGAGKSVTTYSNYNQVKLPPEPKAEMTYQEYLAILAKR